MSLIEDSGVDAAVAKPSLKRPRPVQSCTHCRNKKLKCNRQRPCEKCVKQGLAEDCVYDASVGSLSHKASQSQTSSSISEGPEHTSLSNGVSTGSLPPAKRLKVLSLHAFESLEARVERIEDLLFAAEASDEPVTRSTRSQRSLEDAIASQPDAQPHKALNVFQDAKTLIGSKLSDSETLRLLLSIRKHFPKSERYRPKISTHHLDLGKPMTEVLPPKPTCDKYVTLFFENLNDIYSVFDGQEFDSQYDEYWSSTLQERIDSSFTPCLVLTVLLSSAFSTGAPEMEPQLVLSLVDEWCMGLEDKQLRELVVLQVQTLHALCLHIVVLVHNNRFWVTTGNLVRTALASGLHIGAARTRDKRERSAVQKNLWVTIVELDLQSSLIRGLPTALSKYGNQTHGYRPKDGHILHSALENSLPIRLQSARSLSNSPIGAHAAVEKLLFLEAEQRDRKPRTEFALREALYDIHIHRAIIGFGRPFLKEKALTKPLEILVSSTVRILGYLATLDAHFWSTYLRMCSWDILNGIQIICFILHFHMRQSQEFLGDGRLDFPFKSSTLINHVEGALETLIKNISSETLGHYLKDIVALAAMIGSSRSGDISASREATDISFRKVIDMLSRRVDTETGGVSWSIESTELTTSMDGDAGFWQDGQLDFGDFGVTFDQTYDLDPNSFQSGFDPLWATF